MVVLVNYKNLEIYHLAHNYVLDIYILLERFPAKEEKNLICQIRRAATSLPLNIAEGSAGRSYKIFLTYLYYAYCSSQELEAGLLLAKDLGFLDFKSYSSALEKLDRFIRKLYCYMKYVEGKCETKRSGRKDVPPVYDYKLYERKMPVVGVEN